MLSARYDYNCMIVSAIQKCSPAGIFMSSSPYYMKALCRLSAAQVRNAIKGKGKLELLWDLSLYHQDDLPMDDISDMPDVFSPFKNKACPKKIL